MDRSTNYANQGWRCPDCGKINNAGSGFCTGCGRRMPSPQEAAPGAEKGHFTLFGEDKNGRPAEDLNALQRGMGKETLLISGALTESQAAGLLRSPVRKEGLTLLARDAGCLMLQRETFEGLSRRGVKFAVRNAVRLAAVTVNPVSAGGWHFPEDEFRERMQEAVGVPVLNVMTGEESHDPADI